MEVAWGKFFERLKHAARIVILGTQTVETTAVKYQSKLLAE